MLGTHFFSWYSPGGGGSFWILVTGTWNDLGDWIDTENWID